MRINEVYLLLFFGLMSAPAVYALTETQPVNINADHMTINIKTGDSVYTGNVQFVQGEIKLVGEKVKVQSRDSKIELITVDGKPARYYFSDANNNKVYAHSDHMQYSVKKHRLVMTHNARIEQADNIVESQRIVYDTKKQEILAGTKDSQANDDQRVNVILTPKKK